MADDNGGTSRVETWELQLELPAPLVVGSMTVHRRSYIVVRVTSDDGRAGTCYSLSRDAPIDRVLHDLVAPVALDSSARDIDRFRHQLNRRVGGLGTHGLVGRAASLVEICLWDLAAQAADQPLWQLLHGAGDRDLPVLLADGYPMPDESAEELVERLEQRVADGYTMLKIVAWPDPEEMRRMLRRLRDTIGPGPRLIVDAAWLFEDVSEALRYVAGWDELDVSWLEDAFLPHRAQDIRELHGASLVPIGIGDEATSESEMEILLREGSVDVLRLDATTLGGIAPAVRLAGRALDAGVTPSFHIYPEVHQHLAFSLPAPAHIEQMPRDRTFSLEHLFVQPTSVPHEGMVSPNDTPGTGLEIDWEFVSRHAVRTTASDASTVIR